VTFFWNAAALERSDNVANSGHAFAMLKRGYTPDDVCHASPAP
jgi:hypothetical protein